LCFYGRSLTTFVSLVQHVRNNMPHVQSVPEVQRLTVLNRSRKQSYTCVPLPNEPLVLLSPLWHAKICPMDSDRYELRASPFTCRCSTWSLLAIAITVLCTLAAVLLLVGAIQLTSLMLGWFRGLRNGWELVRMSDDANDTNLHEQIWIRERPKWRQSFWWLRNRKGVTDDDDIVSDGTNENGRNQLVRPWLSAFLPGIITRREIEPHEQTPMLQ
jgi:hypothetical protein